MPAYVDHDERRQQLAEIAADLVADGGADAATVRAVAHAAGYSTKVVSHYFADKRALMLQTYRLAAARSQQRTEESQRTGQADVIAFLHALLPVSDEAQRNWRVWFAFWGLAITDPELAAEQGKRADAIVDRLAAVMAQDKRFRHEPESERRLYASTLFSCILGIAVQAVFDINQWPPQRQILILDQALVRTGLNSQEQL